MVLISISQLDCDERAKKKKKREQKWFSGFGIVTKYPGLFFHLKILNHIFIKNVKYFIPYPHPLGL